MADATGPVSTNVSTSAWSEDEIYSVVGDPVRRRILGALALRGPQPGCNLDVSAGRSLTATLKILASLRDAGFVVEKDNREDRRQWLYALSPDVPLRKTEQGGEIDFGFVVLRL